MKNKDNTLEILVIVLLALFLFGGFGMMGFGGYSMMGHMNWGYGSGYLCENVGGIWCYWPAWTMLFGLGLFVFLIIAIVLIVRRFEK